LIAVEGSWPKVLGPLISVLTAGLPELPARRQSRMTASSTG
jgi:hypothetical protein